MAILVIPTSAPSVKGPPQGQWTLADWESLPDDGNLYEIINGILYMTTAPSPLHQWTVHSLIALVGYPARQQKLALAFPLPIGVIMPGCDPVQPDFVVVKQERAAEIITDKRIEGVPDLIVEILSPGNRSYDEQVKLRAYAEAGVLEFGIVDPEKHQLLVYRLDVPGIYHPPVVYNADDLAHFACLPTIEFRVGDLFADGPESL